MALNLLSVPLMVSAGSRIAHTHGTDHTAHYHWKYEQEKQSLYFALYFILFHNHISLCSLDCPGIPSVNLASFKHRKISLPWPLEYWRHVPPISSILYNFYDETIHSKMLRRGGGERLSVGMTQNCFWKLFYISLCSFYLYSQQD